MKVYKVPESVLIDLLEKIQMIVNGFSSCPHCQSLETVKTGKTHKSQQQILCKECGKRSILLSDRITAWG